LHFSHNQSSISTDKMCESLWRFDRSALISKSTEEKSFKEESGRGSSGEPATELTRQSGNWMQWDGTKKACATGAMTEGTGSAAARLAALCHTGISSRCDLDADPDL
jgi:hypothetical protein